MADIRVVLPQHLQTLARVPDREVAIGVDGTVTVRAILDAIETRFPQLRGTIRDHGTSPSTSGPSTPGKRRPFVRFFACEEDWSHAAPDDPLPAAVADGREPFLVVGAMAGG
jgi:sulfur-carrier protein